MSKGLQFHERDDYGYLIEDLAKWRGALVLLLSQTLASADDWRYRNRQAF